MKVRDLRASGGNYTYLDSRVRRLEDRAERKNQAPLDIIRKLYSKTG